MPTPIDLSSIQLDRVIVHDIPKHKKNEADIQPKYSQMESSLPDGLRLFFKDKIVKALQGDKAFKVLYDSENSAPTSRLIGQILSKEADLFVDTSKGLAKHLFDIQEGNNAAGILLIIAGRIANETCCIILKLERDKGAQLNLNSTTQSFNIVEVHDLMLTQKTRVFKVGLLFNKEVFDVDYDGFVTDYQIDLKSKEKAITYFMERFLGCIAYGDPKINTQNFYKLTKTFIDRTEDQLKRLKYIQDLNSYIQKNQNTINAKEFADDYLVDAKERDSYKNYLNDNRFPFQQSIVKDSQMIANKVKQISVDFENGVSIIGDKGILKNGVKIESFGNEGMHKAEIISKIRKIS